MSEQLEYALNATDDGIETAQDMATSYSNLPEIDQSKIDEAEALLEEARAKRIAAQTALDNGDAALAAKLLKEAAAKLAEALKKLAEALPG